jgi:Tfp pilus assembly protein PilF
MSRPPPGIDGAAELRRAVELHRSGRWAEAADQYERVLRLQPGNPHALLGCGTARLQMGHHESGLALLDRLLAIAPNDPVALSNRGNALRALGRPAEALRSYDLAVAARPDYANAYFNRGLLLQELQRPDEALRDYDRAIALDADFADALYNKAVLLLSTGNYEEGWRLYEWRWRAAQSEAPAPVAQPLWLGDAPATGRRILLRAEGGLGDTIQFCRYAPLVADLGSQVLLEAPAPLVRLLAANVPGGIGVHPRGDPLPPFDLYCPLMSLPLALRTSMATIPATVPYLRADAGKVAAWRSRLGTRAGLRVGLAWTGNPLFRNDLARSIPFRLLERLVSLPVEFHVLQKEIRPDDLDALRRHPGVGLHHEQLADFSDTAALLEVMDLVISVDTAVAHLAGAMAKPVWILLPFFSDHRWFVSRTDSPWYPTAQLFRQQSAGDWAGVLTTIVKRLAQLAVGEAPGRPSTQAPGG